MCSEGVMKRTASLSRETVTTGIRSGSRSDCDFTAVKRKKQENYFKDKVFIFTVQSLILNKYSPGLLNFLEL